jgi:hypothetical protein
MEHEQDKEGEGEERDKAAERFARDLITRGEAAEVEEGEELPPGATHEIEETDDKAKPKLRRRRFSIG